MENLYGHLWASVGTAIPKLKIGELVRLSKVKQHFRKGYLGNWTEEIFRIRDIKRQAEPRVVYKIEDLAGESVEGSFYEEELQSVHKDLEGFWKIESVLKTQVLKSGKKQHFVKWLGYPNSMNSWVNESSMMALNTD